MSEKISLDSSGKQPKKRPKRCLPNQSQSALHGFYRTTDDLQGSADRMKTNTLRPVPQTAPGFHFAPAAGSNHN